MDGDLLHSVVHVAGGAGQLLEASSPGRESEITNVSPQVLISLDSNKGVKKLRCNNSRMFFL